MGLTYGQNLVKWLMLIFNLLFWISGIALIIAGAVAQTVYRPYLAFLDNQYLSAPVLLVVVGAIITIIAFFGCCGSAKESYCMLMTFAVLLGVIFVMEFAGGIAGYVERNEIEGYLGKNMYESVKNYNHTTDHQVWDTLQAGSSCCGVRSYADWNGSPSPVIPASCCKVQNNITCSESMRKPDVLVADCASTAVSSCPVFQVGCLENLSGKFRTSIGAVAGVGVGVAFIQIFGMILSCFLARRIRRGYTYAS